jgi:hypothetical protein
MFTQITPGAPRQRRLLAASVVVHGIVLAWLLHSPEPLKLQPNSVAIGRNGTSVTRLFWQSKSVDNSKHSSPDTATERYKHERLSQNKLTWQPPTHVAKSGLLQNPPLQTQTQDEAKAQTLSALGHGAQAGLPYGTLSRGPFYGDEIIPAYPSAMSDPVFYPWQLPASPGNEVIELTINERGDIVDKKVLASLGSEIDDKCLAALEGWHFHPATRNGAPIPSKYDYIVPFKARG